MLVTYLYESIHFKSHHHFMVFLLSSLFQTGILHEMGQILVIYTPVHKMCTFDFHVKSILVISFLPNCV